MIARFTRGGDPVVAAGTGAQDGGVIDAGHAAEIAGVVAVRAGIGGGDVARVLARGHGAVVATGTVAADTTVVEHRTAEGVGAVAVVTAVVALDMVGGFARGGDPVVAPVPAATTG